MKPSEHRRDPGYERWRWKVFGITWLAYAGFYLTRKAFSIAKNELKKPELLGLTKADMSWIDGANSAAYAIGQFIWGTAGDRFGPRLVVLLGMMASVVIAFLTGASTTVLALGVLLGIQGFVQASGWAPLAKNVGEFFSQRERGRMMGWWCTNYALGGFVASILAGVAAKAFGWRYAFWVPAGALLVIWILFLLFQRNRPEDVGLPSAEDYHRAPESAAVPVQGGDEAKEGSWEAIREVLRNKTVWVLAGVYFLIKPARYLILAWAPVYVDDRLGAGTATSGILGSLFDLAGPVGTLAGGYLSDRVFRAKRMPAAVIALFCLAVVMALFPHLPKTLLSVGLGFFVIGFLIYIPDSLVSGTAAIDFGTRRGASTASGVINGCGSIGQTFGVTIPGWANYFVGQGQDIWNPIFLWLAIGLVLAGLLLLPLWHRTPSEGATTSKRQG